MRLPRLAVLLDGGHVERAERADDRALVLRRLDGDQLIEKRRDLGVLDPGTMASASTSRVFT